MEDLVAGDLQVFQDNNDKNLSFMFRNLDLNMSLALGGSFQNEDYIRKIVKGRPETPGWKSS